MSMIQLVRTVSEYGPGRNKMLMFYITDIVLEGPCSPRKETGEKTDEYQNILSAYRGELDHCLPLGVLTVC